MAERWYVLLDCEHEIDWQHDLHGDPPRRGGESYCPDCRRKRTVTEVLPYHPAILAMWHHRGGERDGWLRFIFRRDATPEEMAEALQMIGEHKERDEEASDDDSGDHTC